jgi:diguanylate cyclase (GGDEF)-like protein
LGDLDSLTGLFNRAAFQKRLAHSLAERKPGMFVAVLFIDLDGFKLINDSMGHPVGDELLRSIGERLTHCVRHSDTLARVDGDEFGVIQVDLAHVEEATVLAERILQTIHCAYEVCGHRIIPRATIGIAVAPVNGADAEQLVKNADIAQYNAKRENTGSWRFYEPEMGVRVQQRRTLETELRAALEGNEFELYYQPFYNIVAQNTCAFEALVRWRHPARGIVPPDQFIGLAEETGLIVPLGAWVLREACMEAAKWPEHVSVSVNLSPVQFRGNSPVEEVREALHASGLAASRLELEITETVLMNDSAEAFAALHQLRALGCRIAMDDFGMGYSSLSYLRSFPFDKIKIDRSFIQDLDYRRRGVEIVRAIASLGNSLQLATTAEGVETQEQYSIVCAEGCTEVQGFLFSEPRPACDVPEMMRYIPEEVRFSLPDSVSVAEPAAKNFFVNPTPDSNIFCGEAI